MNTEVIDKELSDLLQRRWSWQYEERTAAATKQLQQQAEKLAAQAPGAVADCAKLLVAGVRDSPRAASFRAAPVRAPDPEAECQIPWSPVEPLLAGVPLDWENVKEEEVAAAVEKAAGNGARKTSSFVVAAATAPRLPVRNDAGNPAPHVQLFTENGGLVHGGIITVGSHRLVCRAFSWFKHTHNRTMLGLGSGTSEKVHVVAGVCEQFGPNGRVGTAFSTADDLREMYQSTSQPLPGGAWRITGIGAGEGFYTTATPPSLVMQVIRDATKKQPTSVTMPDDGVPDPKFYGSDEFFKISPGSTAAPENALFNDDAIGTAGWVIKTPYLAVYAPDPARIIRDPKDPTVPVIVAMVGATRKAKWTTSKKRKNTMNNFTRSVQWRVRTFKLPLPD